MDQVTKLFDFIPGGNAQAIMHLYFIGSALFALFTSPLIIKLLFKLEVIRTKKGDKIDEIDENEGKIGTPIMGGLIFIITILAITIIFNWSRSFTYVPIAAFILAACLGGIDDLLNTFGKIRQQPKTLKVHIKVAMIHKVWWKRILYFITIPWAAFARIFLFIGSKPKSGLQVHEKLLVQAFIGLTVGYWMYFIVGRNDLWIPFILKYEFIRDFFMFFGFATNESFSSINIGIWIIPLITLIVMTISNAVNISDGMDGLAGGLLLIAFTAYGIIAFGIAQAGLLAGDTERYGFRSVAYLCATSAGAILAYLYFNVKPARVQMGDVGSLAIGTLLSIIAIILYKEITLLFIAGVFIFNGVISRILQSIWLKFTGKKLFQMIPLHYHFKKIGWTEEKIVMRFWIVGVLLTAIGVYLAGL